MAKTFGILIRVVWVATCVTAFVFAYKGYNGISDWRVEEGLAWEMWVLSFPASYLVVFGLILLGAGIGHFGFALPASNRPEITATWLLFVVAGYIQWFIVIPSSVRLWIEMYTGKKQVTEINE